MRSPLRPGDRRALGAVVVVGTDSFLPFPKFLYFLRFPSSFFYPLLQNVCRPLFLPTVFLFLRPLPTHRGVLFTLFLPFSVPHLCSFLPPSSSKCLLFSVLVLHFSIFFDPFLFTPHFDLCCVSGVSPQAWLENFQSKRSKPPRKHKEGGRP